MLEIKCLHKNVSDGRRFANVIEKMNFFWWKNLWTFENFRTGFPKCLTKSYQLSSENLERSKSYGRFCT